MDRLSLALLLPFLLGAAPPAELVVAEAGATRAVVAVQAPPDPKKPPLEWLAAQDLARYIERLSGAKPALLTDPNAIRDALASSRPVLLVGELALTTAPKLKDRLKQVAKKNPTLAADAIVLRREGARVFLAGSNDPSHYFAVAQLLRQWGCRWYLPTDFGEVIPSRPRLVVGALDEAYAPPFELREYWLSWNGSTEGHREFQLRNFMTQNRQVNGGHALGKYMKGLLPPGKTVFQMPIADDATAEHVAKQVEPLFRGGKDFSLGMEDGRYQLDSPLDAELNANVWDKSFGRVSLSDSFLTFYNKVSALLLKAYPQSKSRIGFLAYTNITLPPQRGLTAAKPLVASLAPIDVDPLHAMTDPRSPSRQEYGEVMRRWSQVMQGRVFIYDYDQPMLIWRDLPAPTVQVFREEVKAYAQADILGFSTESRGALATTFLNLFFRGQLMWNPEVDVDALLAEFYEGFYGPAAAPMRDYWTALFQAFSRTLVTEHEHFVIPALYTPELVEALRRSLGQAEKTLAPNVAPLYRERLRFTRLSFDLIDQYTQAWRAAATDGDYVKAVAWGEKALATRLALGQLNPTFTTRVVPHPKRESETPAMGPAWLPGEVEQYRQLAKLSDGTQGKRVALLPLEWSYHRDPHDTGLARGWAYRPADLRHWQSQGAPPSAEQRKDYPSTEWETLRTDLYAQAQGVRHPDGQSFTGHHWYKVKVPLTRAQTEGAVHLRFPGLFNEGWLYVNGALVAHREQNPMWWLNDYAFEWDVDLTGVLRAGENDLTLRLHNPHHLGGMFRRPFLYRATRAATADGGR